MDAPSPPGGPSVDGVPTPLIKNSLIKNYFIQSDIDDAPPTPPAPQDLATARNLVTVLMKSGGLSLALELIEDVMQSSTHAQYDYKMLNMQTEIELILAGAGLREWREQIALTRAKKVVKLAP
jgi:hypothetical protein